MTMFHFQISLFLLIGSIACAKAQTAVLFGASGTVGSEVYRALVQNDFWDEIVVIGRRFPEKLEGFTPQNDDESNPKVTKISLPDLTDIQTNQDLSNIKADACFIALGVSSPQEMSLKAWHAIEIDMIAGIAQLCRNMQVRTVTLLSAIDAEETPGSFTSEELGKSDGSLGWISMVMAYMRVMGLKEHAVITASDTATYIQLFQPNTIVTNDYRYGWVDRSIFAVHKVLDPYLPTRYHSVPVRLLGMAMANSPIAILKADDNAAPRIARLTYGDYDRVAGDDYRKQLLDEKSNSEL